MRKALSNPAQEKACYPNLMLIEQVQQAREIPLNTRRESVPIREVWSCRQVQDVKPVFNVDGENTLHCANPREERVKEPRRNLSRASATLPRPAREGQEKTPEFASLRMLLSARSHGNFPSGEPPPIPCLQQPDKCSRIDQDKIEGQREKHARASPL